jgi:hypothetical protein
LTDEVTFKLNGQVSRRNCARWASENSHKILQEELDVPEITVLSGIWSGGL